MRITRTALAAMVLAASTAVGIGMSAGTAAAVTVAADERLETHVNFSGELFPTVGVPFTFNAWFVATGNIPVPTGSSVTVTRTDMNSPSGISLGTLTTDANGMVSLTAAPPVGGEVIYAFAYAGDDQFTPATGSWNFDIARSTADLELSRYATIDTYGTTVNLTATLGPTYTNRVVEIWSDPAGSDQANRLVKRASANSAGQITAAVKLTRNTVVTARFAGDGRYEAATARATLYTKVSAGTKLTRHYRTKKIGSKTYQVLRKAKNPLVTQTMTPYPGRKVRTIYQIWQNGKWVHWSGRYTKLSATGKASFSFVTVNKVGKRFRVRAEYLPGNSGDSVNYSTVGAWKYFTYTK
ncbi:hypothetical protein Aca07nite_47890 [Actinoplanes capillaceus]|uniref:Uncharacterized protein n=1 Tax=Actinoplanes campanulatus TaxID=113559 RepID=A0ABQ3WMP0_9ACTN|nr:hypothetical protein [Actinoplanes capillaceus]GID47514.1 hypothetical protein Aca07nite_47890 [Actinoplanes capillaceus]